MENSLLVFRDRLEATLQERLSKDATIYRDRDDLREFEEWSQSLEEAIDTSQAMIILFSQAWVESSICWKEYFWAAKNPAIGPDRIFPITLDLPDPEALVRVIPAEYREEGTPVVARIIKGLHHRDFEKGYRERIETLFSKDIKADGDQNRLLRHLVDDMKSALEAATTKMAPAAPPPHKPEVVTIDLGFGQHNFVQVSAGKYTIANSNRERVIAAPFWIMQNAAPARYLMGQAAASEITFERLISGHGVVPHGFMLPSEAEWECAMEYAQQLGIVRPAPKVSEPTRSPLFPTGGRPNDAAYAREDIVSKSSTGRRPLRFGTPVGNYKLRLVYTGDITRCAAHRAASR